MTALQRDAMNTQLWQNIGAIADSKPLMARLAKYAARLAKEKEDASLMSKEEFLAKLEKGEEDYRQGRFVRLMPGESVTEMLRRSGFDV